MPEVHWWGARFYVCLGPKDGLGWVGLSSKMFDDDIAKVTSDGKGLWMTVN